MKFKINTILPIVLALVLPGLSLYANPGTELRNLLGFFFSWLIASLLLYVIWQILWQLWKVKSRSRRVGFIVGLVVILFGTPLVLDLIIFDNAEVFTWIQVAKLIIASLTFLAIQYALKTQQNISHLLVEKEQIQTENYRTQLKALRTQIDPHFLFNSLNTLRSMVRQKHEHSEQFVMSLSDFYRQILKHNENTTLPLSEELTVLQSYLFLMQSRNEEAVRIDLNIDDSLHQFHLPTLALQVVVENCFKHNSLSSKKPLHIEITNTDDYTLKVRNNIQPKIGVQKKSGLGLELLKKRYELMNIQKGIHIEKTPEQFSVTLKLI